MTTRLMLTIILIAFYASHSILAATSVKENLIPLIGYRYYRLFFNLISVIGLIAVIWVFRQTEASLLLEPSPILYIIGGLLLLTGLVVGFFASRQYDLGEFSGTSYLTKENAEDQTLNTTGINGLVRHPLYLSLLLLMFAWFCFQSLSSILTLNLATLAYVLVGVYFEEKKLIMQFGDDYLRYRSEVKMLIPFLL